MTGGKEANLEATVYDLMGGDQLIHSEIGWLFDGLFDAR
jgi:hypothetical protein